MFVLLIACLSQLIIKMLSLEPIVGVIHCSIYSLYCFRFPLILLKKIWRFSFFWKGKKIRSQNFDQSKKWFTFNSLSLYGAVGAYILIISAMQQANMIRTCSFFAFITFDLINKGVIFVNDLTSDGLSDCLCFDR